jgi:hypothetical protein
MRRLLCRLGLHAPDYDRFVVSFVDRVTGKLVMRCRYCHKWFAR